ncbi:MAG: VWA domain-containing protein [Candidatus Omnitrophica bacterium]|nr:VWA domain-containing protein [Candidatus Omnitrophota bacterium]
MKKVRNVFIKNLRYLFLAGVIALGLITVIGTGGGGGNGTTAGGDTTYQEPDPMSSPVTKQQGMDVSLPQGSSLNNEILKILSFYGTSQVLPKAQRLYKTIPVTITDTDNGQIVILVDSQDNPLFFSYLEASGGTPVISSEGIAKGLIWMNPYVMVLPADQKKQFMNEAVKSNLFPQLKDKIDNLLVSDPKNLLDPDNHPEIVKTAFAIVKETFELLISKQGLPKLYKDIGSSGKGGLRILDKDGNDISFENNNFTNYGLEIIDSTGREIYKFVEGMEGIITASVEWDWREFWKLPDIDVHFMAPYETDRIMLTDGKYSIKWYKGFNIDKVGFTGILIPVIPKEWLTPIPSNDIILTGATIAGTATWANTFDAISIIVGTVADLPINKKIGIGRIAKDANRIIGFTDFVNAMRSGDTIGSVKATIELASNKENWVILANVIWGSFGPEAQDFLHNLKFLAKNVAKVLKAVDWINHDAPFFADLVITAPWYEEYCVEQTVGILDECSTFVPLIPPTASLSVSPINPYVGDTVNLDASGSTDDRTTYLEYRFDFDGDGNWDTSWSYNATETYSFPSKGTYNAKAEVMDEDGLTSLANYYVTVYERSQGVSTAIVIDRSGSMRGGALDDAKDAGIAYVYYMGSADRGAVISFDDVVTIDQTFTDDVNLLISAIDSIQLGGMTAFYDAVYTAITETKNENPTRRRAIIALTDGYDNWSIYKQDVEVSVMKLQDVVYYAKQEGIPVYTIGLGDYLDEAMLQDLATQTNGLYFNAPDSSQLKNIYDTIAGIQ